MVKIRQIALVFTAGLLALLALPLAIVAGNSSGGSFTIALEICNVSVSSIGLSEATVSWQTNGNSTSQVYFDTQSQPAIDSYAYYTSIDASLVLNHAMTLTGLSEGTTYHFRVKSIAMVGPDEIFAVSDDYSFTTPGLPPVTTTTTTSTSTTVTTTTSSETTTATTTATSTADTTTTTATQTGTTLLTTTIPGTQTTTSLPQTTTATTSPVVTDTITTSETVTISTLPTIDTTTPSSGNTTMAGVYWTLGVGGIGLSAALLLLFIRRRKKKEED